MLLEYCNRVGVDVANNAGKGRMQFNVFVSKERLANLTAQNSNISESPAMKVSFML